jgi:hypothetical protein
MMKPYVLLILLFLSFIGNTLAVTCEQDCSSAQADGCSINGGGTCLMKVGTECTQIKNNTRNNHFIPAKEGKRDWDNFKALANKERFSFSACPVVATTPPEPNSCSGSCECFIKPCPTCGGDTQNCGTGITKNACEAQVGQNGVTRVSFACGQTPPTTPPANSCADSAKTGLCECYWLYEKPSAFESIIQGQLTRNACEAKVGNAGMGSAKFYKCTWDSDCGQVTYGCEPWLGTCGSGGGSKLCWSSSNPGECKPASSTCSTAGATTTATCYKHKGGTTSEVYTDTLTCTAVADESDPRCSVGKKWNFCFPAGTPVDLADGSQKAIEDVTTLDQVLAYDHKSLNFTSRQVLETFHHPEREEDMHLIHFDDGSTLESTGEHRIYVPSLGEYRSVKDLNQEFKSGRTVILLGKQFENRKITKITVQQKTIKTYNLAVETDHSYVAGNVIVHNEKAETDVQEGEKCDPVMRGLCFADYSYPRFYKCNGTESMYQVFQACLSGATPPACTESSWAPDPAATCSTDTVAQTSNCGTTRTVPGTKSCTPTQSCWWDAVYTAPYIAPSSVGDVYECAGVERTCTSSNIGQKFNCIPGMGSDSVQKGNITCQCGASTPPPTTPKPACNCGRPIVWSGDRGRNGILQCAEFYNPGGTRTYYSQMAEGEEEMMNGQYCTDGKGGCSGSATLKCVNGRCETLNAVCHEGLPSAQ